MKEIGQWLVIAGVAVNVIDGITSIVTLPDGSKGIDSTRGVLFGDKGALKALNVLPSFSIPVPFAGSIPMNIGMWLIVVGIALWAYDALR